VGFLLPTLRQGGGHAECPQSYHHQHGRQGMGAAVLYNLVTFVYSTVSLFSLLVELQVLFSAVFRIRIHLIRIRIRIQHFRLNTDPNQGF
jgi:hypothetical protein